MTSIRLSNYDAIEHRGLSSITLPGSIGVKPEYIEGEMMRKIISVLLILSLVVVGMLATASVAAASFALIHW
jgi:hypothetical protein